MLSSLIFTLDTELLLALTISTIVDPKDGKLSRRALKKLDQEAKKVDCMEVEDEEMQSNDGETMSQCTEVSTYRLAV